MYRSLSSGYGPMQKSRYRDSNLCVSLASTFRSLMPYMEQPALKSSLNTSAESTV